MYELTEHIAGPMIDGIQKCMCCDAVVVDNTWMKREDPRMVNVGFARGEKVYVSTSKGTIHRPGYFNPCPAQN